MKTNWAFLVKNAADNELQIDIYDVIGESWFGGVSAKAVLDKIRAANGIKKINLRVNSLGGNVFDGFAIGNLLRSHTAKVTADVDGVAASAASVLLMGADKIRIADNAMIMIHNSWTYAAGNAEELKRNVEMLQKVDQQIAVTYAERTGQKLDQIRDWMNAETWMTAAEARERGFADEVTPAREIAAMVGDVSGFHNVPMQILERLQRSNAPQPQPSQPAQPAAQKPKETTMNAPAPPAPVAALTLQISAIAAVLGLGATATEEQVLAEAKRLKSENGTLAEANGNLKTELDTAQNDLKAEKGKAEASRKERVTAKVKAAVGQKITPAEEEEYLALALENEGTFDRLIEKRPALGVVGERLAVDDDQAARQDLNPPAAQGTDALSAAAEAHGASA
jgi:ATP-dependent Clp protease protease subunit